MVIAPKLPKLPYGLQICVSSNKANIANIVVT